MGKNKEIIAGTKAKAQNSAATVLKNSPTTRRQFAARHMARSAVDLILPPQTLFRPSRMEVDHGAAQSWLDVNFLDEPCCTCCGFPFDFEYAGLETEAEVLCGRCAVKRPAYDGCRAAFAYDAASRALVLRFKHGGQTEGLQMFASQMARAGRRFLPDADGLMPVPLHYRRRIKRRYNQSTLLARAVSRQTGLPLMTDELMRRRATSSQGGLAAAGRRKNVSGAFSIRPKASVKGAHIILIDDVMTTGATLESCARTLKRAGAARVDAIVLSRVVMAAPPS